MSAPTLLVIADPSAPFLLPLERIAGRVRLIITDDPAAASQTAPDADVILYAATKAALLATILPLAVRARWIHSLWTGVEGILTPQMLEHPAPLTNGRGAFRWPLADWVMAAMLYFSFDLGRVIRQQQAGVWQQFVSSMLEGKTLGIVGYGSIGSAAASRAKGFGMKIAALRRSDRQNGALVDVAYTRERLNDLIAASDYLLLATPVTAETRGMIGAAEIAAMKPSAVLINVGRGPVVDEAALIQALDLGKIRGAALDVFTVEPLPAGHPFYRMTNVLVSPHTADRVEGFLGPPVEAFLENMERFLKGEPLENVVDKHAGY
ncbi:MAG TPA: D-2-hydroxyacid dehydrogenase [Bryobacteraceae bacterium]|jgi:phosphoglycerate dehydrogenase-like enzyme